MNDELTEREYERMLDTFTTASEWHNGQSSALYSYSGTGRIHSEDHQADLIAEIDADLATIARRDDLTKLDIEALFHLRATVDAWPDELV